MSRSILPLLALSVLAAAVAAQPTTSIPGLGIDVTFVQDPETGWNLRSLQVAGEPGSQAIPLHNESANEPLWSVQVFDGSGVPITLNPATISPLHLVSNTAMLSGTILEMEWKYQIPTGPVEELEVLVYAGGLPGDLELYWMATLVLTPRSGHQLSIERFDAPRLAIGAKGQSMNDKLYIPAHSGAIVSNFTDPVFVLNDGERLTDPSPLELSHQQWGVWHTEPSPSYPGVVLNHALPDSQIFFMGTRDNQGWSKSLLAENRFDPVAGSRYLIWEAGHLPSENRTPGPVPVGYTSYNPFTGLGYLVSCGALPTGSQWTDLAARYRQWALSAPWHYLHEAPDRKRRILEQGSGFSPIVRDSSMLAVYNIPLIHGGCSTLFHKTCKEDVAAWRELYINRLGMPPSSRNILTLHYGHLKETELTREGVDKFLDLGSPFQLTPSSNLDWIQEMARVSALPEVFVGVHTYGQGWDRTTGGWRGLPPVPAVPMYPAWPPGVGAPPCGPPAFCVGPHAPTAPVPGLRFSYLTTEFGGLGQGYHFTGVCEDVVLMCPASSGAYRDAHLAALYIYFLLARQTIGANGSLFSGLYLDNMGAPPLASCYYQPLTAEPDDLPHDHGVLGGGRYWISGTRALSKQARDAIRSDLDPGYWTHLEMPSEHWIGAADLIGSYQRDHFSYFGSYGVPGFLRAPWSLTFPFPPGHESVAVPGFETVYGDCVFLSEWTNVAYDGATHTAMPQPPVFPDNLLPPGSPLPLHPGVPEPNALCAYNSYAYEALGFTAIAQCPGSTPAAIEAAPIFFQGGWRTIGTRPTAQERWDDLLWWVANYAFLRDALNFNFKMHLMSVNFRGGAPLYPDHLNPDISLGSLVADGRAHRFLMAMQTVRGDWRDWYVFGPRLGQPIAEPSAHQDFAARAAREIVDVSFASCHGHHSTPGDSVIAVTNWMPYPVSFDIHFSPVRSGFSPAGPASVAEHTPDLGDGAPPPAPKTLEASPFPGHMKFTTSVIGAGELKVYRLQ